MVISHLSLAKRSTHLQVLYAKMTVSVILREN